MHNNEVLNYARSSHFVLTGITADIRLFVTALIVKLGTKLCNII